MTKNHLVFIVNPKSGTQNQKETRQAIETCLDSSKFTWEIQNTEYRNHGTILAKKAADNGAYGVVAVGGDGSINDIVQGLIGTDTLMAIIPKGSGNGLARTLEIPLTTTEAVNVINTGKIIPMDVGLANGRPFVSNAGVAFDALISKKFSDSSVRGIIGYAWLVTSHIWTYQSWVWDIIIDGEQLREKAFMVNVANGQQFGYNFYIAPGASCQDGMLDVVVIRQFPKIFGGTLAYRGLTGTLTKSPFVRHYKGKEIIINNPKLKLMQADGDARICESTVTFKVAPFKQRMIVP